ncbi:Transposase, IS4-like [Legionella lansingensis]|uniref:transposase n=1 Tax=Legionella lansingensis TaxID=45067 RepID=UPI0004909F31|nr:transposase [Legionella lansingensis]SNV52825.1 Transposase, IS4-like [Legionella lansingensis]
MFPPGTKASAYTYQTIDELLVAKTNPIKAHCYSYKHILKGRKKYGRIKRDQVAIKASKGYREPWILVSSLNRQDKPGKIIQIYKQRMTIEENFRDTKSPQFGFGLKENVCHTPERLSAWLLLVALATLIAFYVGHWIERMGMHR